MRALLLDGADCTDSVHGPGIAGLDRSAPETLMRAIKRWTERFGKVDILLSGMAGSNIGWRTAAYIPCPADFRDICDQCLRFEHEGHRVAIVPGVSGVNGLGLPDVMRGEELQVFGWLASDPERCKGDYLVCLPGTHTKWVNVSDGRIKSFGTSMTGELYALLLQRSVLFSQSERQNAAASCASSFLRGLEVVDRHEGALLHTLFSTRAISLVDADNIGNPSSYLSGLLIGEDVRIARETYGTTGNAVAIIGERLLAQQFSIALQSRAFDTEITDGTDAVSRGFGAIIGRIWT